MFSRLSLSFEKVLQDRRSKPKVELEFTRSDKGLGQVFEEAFLAATAAERDGDDAPPEQKEARRLFADLCSALDALTSGHYRPSAPEPRAISVRSKDVAAVALEEVAPIGASGAQLLAPEEIGGRPSHMLQSAAELEHEDRQKQRRQRKEAAKRQREEKESQMRARAAADPAFAARMQAAKEAKLASKGKESEAGGGTKAGKQFTQSTTFFRNLQESMLADPEKKQSKTKKAKTKESSAAKFKL